MCVKKTDRRIDTLKILRFKRVTQTHTHYSEICNVHARLKGEKEHSMAISKLQSDEIDCVMFDKTSFRATTTVSAVDLKAKCSIFNLTC